MKLHLPHCLLASLLQLFSLSAVTFCPNAYSSSHHADISMATYADFGQNMGRYRTREVNSLLQHLNAEGVQISYLGGQPNYTLLHGMISYESQGDNGAYAAIGYGFIATVQHNGAQNGSFTSRYIGSDSAIQYASIEYRNSDTFLLTPTADFKISRQSKIITDITPAEMYNGDAVHTPGALVGQLVYRAGSGRQYLADYNGNTTTLLVAGYQYITGGISTITSNGVYSTEEVVDGRGIVDDSATISYWPKDWTSTGISDVWPLPDSCATGDSGSPMYIWNEESQSYQYLGAMQSGGANLSVGRTASQWILDTIASFDKVIDCSAESTGSTVYINGVTIDSGETITDGLDYTTNPWYGTVTNADGETLVSFCGVKSGSETWAALNSEMDKEKWYAYSNSFLNTSQSETSLQSLFMTENLVFTAGSQQAETDIVLTDNVDLGVGYVEFRVEEGSAASFHLRSQEGENYILSSAGYVVGAGADVYLHLTNPSDYAREWRKTGEGNLHIQGDGDNYVALNLGGSGTTYLERDNGYAAYNVLANNGTTVVLREGDGIQQIARDFTFGNGGATLDFNGNSMVWNNDAAVEDEGFSIHALTEDAIITNRKEGSCTTLTVTQGGAWEFKGSFVDTADSALHIVYQGGEDGAWKLRSIHTNLQQEQSGLTVQSGTVSLEGSNTVHGMGSTGEPSSVARYSNEDDWHYADATMTVTVQDGGSFELGSHARLIGDVSVEEGGTFLMREGVGHQYEYIEGWYTKEDTNAIRDYFGLKGNVHLAEGAAMKVEFHEGVTSHLIYEHNITGAGSLSVDTALSGGMLVLSGQNTFSGEKEIVGGALLAASQEALGDISSHRWIIRDGGSLASESFTADTSSAEILNYIDSSSTGALALTESRTEQLDLSEHTGLFIGALEGYTVEYGEAGTNEALIATPGAGERGQWLLGGGGGELVVNFRLTGDNDLVLGNESQRGVVTLTNQNNDFSGDILFTESGGVTLTASSAGVLGNGVMQLNYTNRFVSPNGINNVDTNASGAILLDQTPNLNLNLAEHQSLCLGSLEDTSYSGVLSLAEGQAYRFGATEATFTVHSQVGGAHDLIVDGQTYSGGCVVLTNIQNLTGSVAVIGRDSGYTTGDITLRLTQDDALASASRVSLYQGGHLDIAGTSQIIHELSLGAGSVLSSSTRGGELLLHYDSQGMLSGSLNVENIEKTGSGTLLLNGENNTYSTFHFWEGAATLMSDTGLSAAGNAIFHEGTSLTINEGVTAEANILLDGGAVNISKATLGATGSITAQGGGGSLSAASGTTVVLNGSIGAVRDATLTVTGSAYKLSAQQSNIDGGIIDFQATSLELYRAAANQEQRVGGTLLINKAAGSTTTLSSSGARDNLIRTLDRIELGAGNTLLIKESSWNTIWNIHELAGEGTLQWNSTTTHWYSSRLVLDGENSFTGDIILNRTAPTSRQSDRFYSAQMELAHNLAAQNAVVTLQGNNSYSIASLAVNTENAHLVGLQGSAYSRLWAGATTADADGKATTVDEVTTYSPPESTRNATLTITGDGSYTFSGIVSAGEEGYGLSLVMDGSGSQTFNGASVELNNVTVNRGELHLSAGQLSVTGDISLAGGALLDMGENFTLASGQTLAVSGTGGEDSSAALFTSNLTLAGGDLSFGELSAASDAPALSLGGVSFAEDLTMQTVLFTSSSALQIGVSYLLADGDWSSLGDDRLTASVTSDYLTAQLTSGSDGLRVTFSAAEGSSIWQGTEEEFSWDTTTFGPNSALSSETTAIFNDLAANKTVLLADAVTVDTVFFDNSQAASYLVESGEEGSLTTRHLLKESDGTTTIRADVTVTGDTDVNGGTLIMEQGSLLGNLNIQQGEVRLSGSATLGVSDDGTPGALNIMEGGRLQVDAELHEAERSLVLNQGEISLGGATNELKSITATGGVLSGAAGSHLTTETLQFTAGNTLTVDGVYVSVSQGNTSRTLNEGSVTTIDLTGGGTLDDRNSYYNLSGTLNIGSTEEGAAANGTIFIDGICLSRQNTQSFLNVASGATLVVTGEKTMTGTTDPYFGSFSLSHWGSALRSSGKYNQVNIGGTLTINSIISAWDNIVSINIADGGAFNLLKGLSRNTERSFNVILNAQDGSRLNTAGGAHNDSLVVNLKAGSTLGMVGQDVSLSNNLKLGTDGANGTVTIDTQASQVEEETFAVKAVEEGGHIHLSGAVSSVGQTALNIVGKGLLSVSGSLAVTDGIAIQQETALSLSAEDSQGVSLSSSPRSSSEEARLTGGVTLSLSGSTATISGEEENRTHLDNVLVQLSEGSSLVLEHAVVEADTIISGQVAVALATADATSPLAASVDFHDVVLQCQVGTNTERIGESVLSAGTQLFEAGGSGEQPLTLNSDSSVLQLSSDMLSHIDFTGSQLTLDFSGLDSVDNFDFIAIQFQDSLLNNLSSSNITATLNGEEQHFVAYVTSPEEATSTIYFSTQLIPEPTTSTLSLLALAALAARRRRR